MKRAAYNKQGERIMRITAYRAGIHSLEELAEKTGIPYTTIYKRLSHKGDFGSMKLNELMAIVRVGHFTSEDLKGVVTGG